MQSLINISPIWIIASWWFQPIWNYERQIGSFHIISPGRGDNKTCLKPPPRWGRLVASRHTYRKYGSLTVAPTEAVKGSHHIRCPSRRYPNTPHVFETRSLVGGKFQNLDLPGTYSWCRNSGFRNVIYLLVFWVTSLVIVGMIVSIIWPKDWVTEVDTQMPGCPSCSWKQETRGVLMKRVQSNRYTTAGAVENWHTIRRDTGTPNIANAFERISQAMNLEYLPIYVCFPCT